MDNIIRIYEGALRIIAGEKPCSDNRLDDKDIAKAALRLAEDAIKRRTS